MHTKGYFSFQIENLGRHRALVNHLLLTNTLSCLVSSAKCLVISVQSTIKNLKFQIFVVFVFFVVKCWRLYAQIGLFDVFIVQELLSGAAQHNAAIFQNVATVTDFQGMLGILLD